MNLVIPLGFQTRSKTLMYYKLGMSTDRDSTCLSTPLSLKIINLNDIVFMILQDGVCCDFAVLNGRYVAACFEVSLYILCSVTRDDY